MAHTLLTGYPFPVSFTISCSSPESIIGCSFSPLPSSLDHLNHHQPHADDSQISISSLGLSSELRTQITKKFLHITSWVFLRGTEFSLSFPPQICWPSVATTSGSGILVHLVTGPETWTPCVLHPYPILQALKNRKRLETMWHPEGHTYGGQEERGGRERGGERSGARKRVSVPDPTDWPP